MPTAGIICEYNPFHNGHLRQFSAVREQLGADTAIVCLMSGGFVQRGQPALYDASVRAEAAVRCGADIVLELPVNVVLRSAEGFASGGVSILGRLGVCTHLSFGCEDPELVTAAADIMCGPSYGEALRCALKNGMSYPAACQAAYEARGLDGSFLSKPNNILGVEYCRALRKLESSIVPLPLRRGSDYHSMEADREQPSAEYLRTLENITDFVPPAAAACYSNQALYRMNWGDRAVLARLRSLTAAECEVLPYASEGLWNRILRAAASADTVEETIQMAKSRRYPYTRIARMVLCAYLGLSDVQLREEPAFVRVLGFSERGRAVLREAGRREGITLLHAGERCPEPAAAELERRCALLRELFRDPYTPRKPTKREQVFRMPTASEER